MQGLGAGTAAPQKELPDGAEPERLEGISLAQRGVLGKLPAPRLLPRKRDWGLGWSPGTASGQEGVLGS